MVDWDIFKCCEDFLCMVCMYLDINVFGFCNDLYMFDNVYYVVYFIVL